MFNHPTFSNLVYIVKHSHSFQRAFENMYKGVSIGVDTLLGGHNNTRTTVITSHHHCPSSTHSWSTSIVHISSNPLTSGWIWDGPPSFYLLCILPHLCFLCKVSLLLKYPKTFYHHIQLCIIQWLSMTMASHYNPSFPTLQTQTMATVSWGHWGLYVNWNYPDSHNSCGAVAIWPAPTRHFIAVWWVRRWSGTTGLRYINRSFGLISQCPLILLAWNDTTTTTTLAQLYQLTSLYYTPLLNVDTFLAKLRFLTYTLHTLWLIPHNCVFRRHQ